MVYCQHNFKTSKLRSYFNFLAALYFTKMSNTTLWSWVKRNTLWQLQGFSDGERVLVNNLFLGHITWKTARKIEASQPEGFWLNLWCNFGQQKKTFLILNHKPGLEVRWLTSSCNFPFSPIFLLWNLVCHGKWWSNRRNLFSSCGSVIGSFQAH